jgi:RNA polymerase primary sigma factor
MIVGPAPSPAWIMSQLHLPKYRSLTRSEERALFVRLRAGDRKALDLLFNANLKFVTLVCKQYLGKGLDMEELIAEGSVGLVKGIQRFDCTTNFKLIC